MRHLAQNLPLKTSTFVVGFFGLVGHVAVEPTSLTLLTRGPRSSRRTVDAAGLAAGSSSSYAVDGFGRATGTADVERTTP